MQQHYTFSAIYGCVPSGPKALG